MTFDNSLPEGNIIVPVWSDNGVIKPLADDEGKIGIYGAVTMSDREVYLYYWDGDSWEKWTGNPISIQSQLYYWDTDTWFRWLGNPTSIQSRVYYWDGDSWEKWTGNISVIDTHNLIWDYSSWKKQTIKWTLQNEYFVKAVNSSTTTQDTNLDSAVVPSDRLVKLKEISLYHDSDTITRARLCCNMGDGATFIEDVDNIAKDTLTRIHMEVIMSAGYFFRILWYGCTNGDYIQFCLYGELYDKE